MAGTNAAHYKAVLPKATVAALRAQVQMYWSFRMVEPEFKDTLSGREVGHRIAPLVEEETVRLLGGEFSGGSAKSKDGSEQARSMGDTWLKHMGVWHPINVKTGLVGRTGRPNLVSLRRAITALSQGEIDSYWLVLVHFNTKETEEDVEVSVVNLFDHLEFVAFDAGTGQLMLKGSEFLAHTDTCYHEPAPREATLRALWDIYEEGVERLIRNRQNTLLDLAQIVGKASPELNQEHLGVSGADRGATPEFEDPEFY